MTGRTLRGLLQEQLALECEMSVSYLRRIEHGAANPTINELSRIAEALGAEHEIIVEPVEDEFYVSVRHLMTRSHHISFLAFVSDERLELVKLYPEGDAAARFSLRGGGWLYAYCNRHGLIRRRV